MPSIDTIPAFFAISHAALNVFVGSGVAPPVQLWLPYAAPCVAQENSSAQDGDCVLTLLLLSHAASASLKELSIFATAD